MPRGKAFYRPVRYFCHRKSFNTLNPKEQANTKTVNSQEKVSLKQSQSDRKENYCSRELNHPSSNSFPINNILVLPQNSDTLINVISQKKRKIPLKNFLRKLNHSKRQKQNTKKMKYKEDIKPDVSKIKIKNMSKSKTNKHTIILSDSEDEVFIKNSFTNLNPSPKVSHENEGSSQQDDDVVIIEIPQKNDIIEIDDTELPSDSKNDLADSNYKPHERNEIMSTPESSGSNDFIDTSHSKVQSKFNFSLHGSDFRDSEFLRPCVPVEFSESGSISSVSDVSTTIKANVFNIVDFPKEKENLFDENNLEKFKDSITPNRNYKSSDLQKNLPTLSDISRVENDQRRVRGQSIIREMVNDRAYVLLSSSQKKIKNKKRKSKSEDNCDSLDENDSNENNSKLKKKRKRKKVKKKDENDEDYIEFTEVTENDILVTSSPLTNNVSRKKETLSEKSDILKLNVRSDIFLDQISVDKTENKKTRKKKESEYLPADIESSSYETPKKRRKDSTIEDKSSDPQSYECETEENSKMKKKKKRKGHDEVSYNSENKSNNIIIENDEADVNELKKKRKKKRSTSENSLCVVEENTEVLQDEVEDKNNVESFENPFKSFQIMNVMSLNEEAENPSFEETGKKISDEIIKIAKESLPFSDRREESEEIAYIQQKVVKVEDDHEIVTESASNITCQDCPNEKVTVSLNDPLELLTTESCNLKDKNVETIITIDSVKQEKESENDSISQNNLKEIIKSSPVTKENERLPQICVENNTNVIMENITVKVERPEDQQSEINIVEESEDKLPDFIENMVSKNDNNIKELCAFLESSKDSNEVFKKITLIKNAFSPGIISTSLPNTTQTDNEDILETMSISSNNSSIICIENSTVIDVEDDITLANCDVGEVSNRMENLEESIIKVDESTMSKSNLPLSEELSIEDDKLQENQSATERKRNSIEKEQAKAEDIILNVENSRNKEKDHTSKSSKCVNLGSYERTLDKYDVDAVQLLMKDDPRLWEISSADIPTGRIIPTKSRRCTKCRDLGHLQKDCPNKNNPTKCALCGLEGHLDFRCPHKMCTQCGSKSAVMKSNCSECRHYKNITCSLCKLKGHPRQKCPDLWRRYHLTVAEGPLVKCDGMLLKEKSKLWCSYCAKPGHLEYYCYIAQRNNRHFRSIDPRIHSYVDIYIHDDNMTRPQKNKKASHSKDDRCQNIEESSHTQDSPQSSQQNIPINVLPDLSQNQDTIDSATTSTIIEEEQNPSMNNGIEDLPKDFYVIDEVQNSSTNENIEEEPITKKDDGISCNSTNNINSSSPSKINKNRRESEMDCCKFFMTTKFHTLRDYVRNELLLLSSSQFRVRSFIYRLLAYEEDDRKPSCEQRIEIEKKVKFYKDLNMLVFGKAFFKGGKFHLRKLEMFVNTTDVHLTVPLRESLLFSFNYIFSSKKHEYMNYSYFLKLIQGKHGNEII